MLILLYILITKQHIINESKLYIVSILLIILKTFHTTFLSIMHIWNITNLCFTEVTQWLWVESRASHGPAETFLDILHRSIASLRQVYTSYTPAHHSTECVNGCQRWRCRNRLGIANSSLWASVWFCANKWVRWHAPGLSSPCSPSTVGTLLVRSRLSAFHWCSFNSPSFSTI